jgi:hypothetical protein
LSYTADESPVVLNLTDDNGCAYTATLTINEYPVTPNIVNSVTVCEGASYIWPQNGLSYTADESPVVLNLTDDNGCTYTATLTINEYPVTPNIVNSVTVCEGASYTWPQNGLSYTADESPVVLNLTDDNGCTYTATLTINEYPVTPNIVNSVTVCEGASYIWPQNGLSYTADESPVVLNLTDDNGCAYTATLTINEYPVTPNIVNSVTVCEGASYTWPQNGLSYTADESPVVLNLTDDNGCAYTATLTINEYPVTPNIVNSVTVCEGASYTWPQNGLSYTADESPVVLNLTDDNGCAYTATLTINEYPVTPNIVNSVTVCEGASYTWPQNGLSYTADESPVVLNLTDDNGCAYTATLTINEYPVTPNIVNSVTVCEGASYTWPQNGLSYTADESPVVLNLTDDNGCAYTATLTINEYPVTPNIVNSVTVCEGASYTWPQNGLSYTADESPVVLNLTDDNGCAYTATLTINEYPVTPNIVNSVTVCEGASYIWPVDGKTYTADDSPVEITLTDANGCDYTATLTIDEDAAPDAGGNGVLTVCEGSIPTEAELFAALTGTPDAGGEWSGPVNGVYTYTFAASGSCPESSATVTVDEYPVTPNIVNSVTVCEGASYIWPQNGLSYTADESPVVLNLTDDNGCTYTATLTINEYPVTPNIVNSVTVCEGASYTWPQNGLSYTADESPVVLNLTDDNGCTYTATLTINEYPVTPNIVNSVTVCEGASIPGHKTV